MLLDDADAPLLKAWITKRLDAVSDADEDVLSDYILALVSSPDESAAAAKTNCLENLKDFLGDAANKFVDDLFTTIITKSYAPKATLPAYQPPRKTSVEPPREQTDSRKRSYHDWDRDEAQGSLQGGGERPWKQSRRGRRSVGFDQREEQQVQNRPGGPYHQQTSFPQMPTPPPGMPPFDMNNPMASFMAMQQAMGMLPGFALPDQNGSGLGLGQRCKDFDTKGYCTKGASCPFDHGADAYVVPDEEYDPNHATLMSVQPNRTGVVNGSFSARSRGGRGRRGRGGGSNFRGGGKRADISMLGANHDPSITSIVVEQIPEDKFDERIVRDFFEQFGSIEEITMKPYKRLCIVKYRGYDSAKAAYDSPKVIFDNRFVKVYWYNPDRLLQSQTDRGPSIAKRRGNEIEVEEDEPQVDSEELAKRQEEAQRRHDEQNRQREEAKSKKKELDAQVKAIDAERKKITDALAKKTGGKSTSPATEIPDHSNESEQAKGLRAQLAKLEAEAKSLGIDPNVAANSYEVYSGYRGRGGFRAYRGRGTNNSPFRGGWIGSRGGAVKRLDNRPKTVAITFTEGSYEDHEESLRQWLLFNGPESATLTRHPGVDRQDVALVAFPERYLGESFMTAASGTDFPLSGRVELSWWKVDPPELDVNPTVSAIAQPHMIDPDTMEEAPSGRDVDSDDWAENDDRWG